VFGRALVTFRLKQVFGSGGRVRFSWPRDLRFEGALSLRSGGSRQRASCVGAETHLRNQRSLLRSLSSSSLPWRRCMAF
jgi:hypothetical protein